MDESTHESPDAGDAEDLGAEAQGLDDLAAKLETLRDELRVKLHLGAADMHDEWDELDEKWARFKDRFGEAADDTAEDVGQALELLADELKRGYQRLKDSM